MVWHPASQGRIVGGALVLPIARENIRFEKEIGWGKYINPEYAILLSEIADINHQDIILTAVCWLLKWRPVEVPIQTIAIPAELQPKVTVIRLTPISDHIIALMAMGGLITLASKACLTQPCDYSEYLRLRWKTVCATLNMGNIIEQGQITNETYMEIMQMLVTWQTWLQSQDTLKRMLLNLIFKEGEREPFVAGILNNVQFCLKNYGLKAAYLMENFILLKNGPILLPANLLQPIISQAVNLKKALTELKAKHVNRFPYLMVYPLEGTERLHRENYPDLFNESVRIATKKKKS
ncbi:uncharacterized protein LOC105197738 [Solenopsis invicta]|uniref:uncharacterized protein LOC105197738 n=1 Tax=Solenopsis invicta TaxID=13686 RepID=UPI00193DD9A5|nr:uncharacterized protein LOC105197738 [Solenopsis invicta]XP_039310603.1 uncharacterized protein LOC105197738 [Solenopsis invicta]